ncbi:MAG: hypothetical protein D6705_06170 [Deltaproteobacteria bacterium]|nr:MAG: hypothetical protein D6705_06170 [Deltaproteobacteria bacterium]
MNPDCGNGNLDPGEECDDGNLDPTDTCTADCKVSDLLLWYDFEGDAANMGTEPGYDGTVDAAATYVAGKQGMALQCASETPGVTIPNLRDLLLAHPDLTIGMWVKEASVVPNTTLFSFRGPNPLRNGIESYHGVSNSAAIFTCADGTNDFSDCEFFTYSEGPWHHIVWRYAGTGTNAGEGADVEIYFDGDLVATIANPTKQSVLTPDILLDGILCSGRGNTPPQPNFQIDEFKIWGATYDVATQCEVVVGGTWENNACTLP